MNIKALAIGGGLWAIDLCFALFMGCFTPAGKTHLFWPVVIALLVILAPINLFVAGRMPGVK